MVSEFIGYLQSADFFKNKIEDIIKKSKSKDFKFDRFIKFLYESVMYDISIKAPHIYNKCYTLKIGEDEIILPSISLLKGEITVNNEVNLNNDINDINYSFINYIEDKGKVLQDKPTFRLFNYTDNVLNLGISSYFKSFSSCDYYYYKLSEMYQKNDISTEFVKKWLIELSNRIESNDLSSYSSSLGMSVLLIMKIKNKDIAFIVENSEKKDLNKTRHVIPSFMFQPTTSYSHDINEQTDIKIQLLREFAEELFDMKELENEELFESIKKKMFSNKFIKRLEKKLSTNNKIHFKTLGLSLDVFRLRPEILSILYITDSKLIDLFYKDSKRNWESKEIISFDINNENFFRELFLNKEYMLVPPAMACLVEGREYYLKNIKGKNELN